MSEKQYAYLTTITWSGIVNVSRIILGHNVNDSWVTQLIHKDKLIITTDQDLRFDCFGQELSLKIFKEVHFNGQIIYKDWRFWKRWWR